MHPVLRWKLHQLYEQQYCELQQSLKKIHTHFRWSAMSLTSHSCNKTHKTMLYCHRIPSHLAYAATIIIAWPTVWNPLLSVIILNSCAVSALRFSKCTLWDWLLFLLLMSTLLYCVYVGCTTVILCSTLYIRNQARSCCKCRKNKLVDCCGPFKGHFIFSNLRVHFV